MLYIILFGNKDQSLLVLFDKGSVLDIFLAFGQRSSNINNTFEQHKKAQTNYSIVAVQHCRTNIIYGP